MRVSPAALALLSCVTLTGCSALNPVDSGLSSIGTIIGSAFGGRQPINQAHIYLLEASITGYAGPGIAPSTANASKSLLTAGGSVNFPTVEDTNGDYYVVTNANGGFNITGDYTCDTGGQVYIYSVGGDPGGGVNAAAGLIAPLGTCGSFGSTTRVNINEAATIATAYAVAGFATDATHIGILDSPLAETGLANAFANANLLYDIHYLGGTAGAPASTPNGNGVVPQKQVDTLANILAACVDSDGPTSGQCTGLLSGLMSNGTTGTEATDTATEAIYMAHNPTVTSVYSVTGPGAVNPYTPWNSSIAPNDFTIAILYSGGGISSSTGVAIDSSGDAWTTNSGTNAIAELSPLGVPISTAAGFTGGGLNNPSSISIDTNGNVWATNNSVPYSVSEFSDSGAVVSTSAYVGGGFDMPSSIAIDANGNAWIANHDSSNPSTTVSWLSGSNGIPISTTGISSGGISGPAAVAVDASGFVWVTDSASNSVSRLSTTDASATSSVGYTGTGVDNPSALAIDGSGNVWVANYTNSTVSTFSSNGNFLATTSTVGGLNLPTGIAIDGSGDAWIVNQGSYSLAQLSSTGDAISPTTGYTSGGLTGPNAVAIDGSGNVWVADTGATLKEFIGAATPVATPLVSAIKTGKLGTRP